jgi:hypothetical protein
MDISSRKTVLRERPFNLKGGGVWFFSKKNILILVGEKKPRGSQEPV